jgi:hypothetical protein
MRCRVPLLTGLGGCTGSAPSNDMTKAIICCLTCWDAFMRFLDDGRLCMSNNAAQFHVSKPRSNPYSVKSASANLRRIHCDDASKAAQAASNALAIPLATAIRCDEERTFQLNGSLSLYDPADTDVVVMDQLSLLSEVGIAAMG